LIDGVHDAVGLYAVVEAVWVSLHGSHNAPHVRTVNLKLQQLHGRVVGVHYTTGWLAHLVVAAEPQADEGVIGNHALPRDNAALAAPRVVRLAARVHGVTVFTVWNGATLLDLQHRVAVQQHANENIVDGEGWARKRAARTDSTAEAKIVPNRWARTHLTNIVTTTTWHVFLKNFLKNEL
jgi:hypothetical protein